MKLNLKSIEGTLEASVLEKCNHLYEVLEEKEQVFCRDYGIRCRKSCGTCCMHFHPDVTAPEALYMAYGIISEGKEEETLERLKDYDGEACPFFSEKEFCTEYAYRPLICRLFNACASNDKDGNPVFRSCKWDDLKENYTIRDFGKKDDVITMEEFGEQMEEILPGENQTELLKDAIPKALGKLMLILMLEDEK